MCVVLIYHSNHHFIVGSLYARFDLMYDALMPKGTCIVLHIMVNTSQLLNMTCHFFYYIYERICPFSILLIHNIFPLQRSHIYHHFPPKVPTIRESITNFSSEATYFLCSFPQNNCIFLLSVSFVFFYNRNEVCQKWCTWVSQSSNLVLYYVSPINWFKGCSFRLLFFCETILL